MFFLPFLSENFFFQYCHSASTSQLKKQHPVLQVDRASGILCQMSTLEPQLCFDNQKKIVHCVFISAFYRTRLNFIIRGIILKFNNKNVHLQDLNCKDTVR